MDYLCSIRIDVPGWSSVKIKNQLVRAIETSSKICQYQVEFVRRGRFTLPRIQRRTKKEVIEVFIQKEINKCFKEFARIHGLEKKNAPRTSKYKEKKGSHIEEFLLYLPDNIAGNLAAAFLIYLATQLKKVFEKLIKEKLPKKRNDKNKEDGDQPPKENEAIPTVQVNIGKISAGNVTIIINK